MINPMDLSGKHILITGASSGIGRETCILVSKLGAKVSMVARNEEKLAETLSMMEGEGHQLFPFDLSQLEEIETKVKEIVAAQGKVDGFVHCAGIDGSRQLQQVKYDFLDKIMHINFESFAELLRILSSKRMSNDGGSFIGISSTASISGGRALSAYASTKAAMNGFIHPAAKELAPRKIRVNTLAFGMIDTGMFDWFKSFGGSVDRILSRQYLGIGQPIDAANAIAFLLSDAARFITGTTIAVDGGFLS